MLLDYIKYSSNTLFFTFPPSHINPFQSLGVNLKKRFPRKKKREKRNPFHYHTHPKPLRPSTILILFLFTTTFIFFTPKKHNLTYNPHPIPPATMTMANSNRNEKLLAFIAGLSPQQILDLLPENVVSGLSALLSQHPAGQDGTFQFQGPVTVVNGRSSSGSTLGSSSPLGSGLSPEGASGDEPEVKVEKAKRPLNAFIAFRSKFDWFLSRFSFLSPVFILPLSFLR